MKTVQCNNVISTVRWVYKIDFVFLRQVGDPVIVSRGQTLASFPGRSQAVPGSSFDRLQYKNGGEGLGERVTCVTSGRREGRREGGGERCPTKNLEVLLVISCPRT